MANDTHASAVNTVVAPLLPSEVRESPPAVAPAILQYAMQQKLWERGISWLLGIVCVSQLLMIPAPILKIRQLFSGSVGPLPRPWRMVPSWHVGDYVALGESILFPAGAMVIAICAFFLLMRARWPRIPLLAACLLQIVVIFAAAGGRVISGAIYRLGYGGNWMPDSSELLAALQQVVSLAYPILLLYMVLRQVASNQVTHRRGRATAIWWTTAAACMLVSAGTAVTWIEESPGIWYLTCKHVFGVLLGTGWLESMMGVGEITGAFAAFSSYVIVGYTVLRGRRGRQALLICAALFFVAAVFTAVPPLIEMPFQMWSFRVGHLSVYDMERIADRVYPFAIAVAFPLAIRMALSLSAVRAQLDGEPLGS
jgi:hypothetical protein